MEGILHALNVYPGICGVCLREVHNWAQLLVFVHLGVIHILPLKLKWPLSHIISGLSYLA